jgi:hypothetical protein
MQLRALEGKEKVLGLEHPETLVSAWGLAVLFGEQWQYPVAQNGFLKVLGVDHPYTRRCLKNY